MRNKFNWKITNILFILLLSTSVFASDHEILTDYRLYGIKSVEKALNKSLANVDYWKEFLKDKDTKFGYIESYTNILLCDKSKSELFIYSKDSNNTY